MGKTGFYGIMKEKKRNNKTVPFRPWEVLTGTWNGCFLPLPFQKSELLPLGGHDEREVRGDPSLYSGICRGCFRPRLARWRLYRGHYG